MNTSDSMDSVTSQVTDELINTPLCLTEDDDPTSVINFFEDAA